MYSAANIIPINALNTTDGRCGEYLLSFRTVFLGRALWFSGKFALVGYEIYIVAASIWALLRWSSRTRVWIEAGAHLACGCLGLAAFLAFQYKAHTIEKQGYNEATETYVQLIDYNFMNDADDQDDYNYGGYMKTEVNTFLSARDKYNRLVRSFLLVWDGLLGLAVLLWIVVRVVHRRALSRWQRRVDTDTANEAVDPWGSTRQSEWGAVRAVRQLERAEYTEVWRPLEAYILIFVLFGVPAVLMSTEYCASHSAVNTAGQLEYKDGSYFGGKIYALSYGECFVWAELALSFRTLATVCVYGWGHRHALARVLCGRAETLRDETKNEVGDDAIEMARRESAAVTAGSTSVNPSHIAVELPVGSAASATDWTLTPTDLTPVRMVGEGTTGQVWEGRLRGEQRVAIKFLLNPLQIASTSDDGGGDETPAYRELQRECGVLQRVQHPNLLRFLGAGMTEDGLGFLVTEFMEGGSLFAALHNPAVDLPWRRRLSIAMQVCVASVCTPMPADSIFPLLFLLGTSRFRGVPCASRLQPFCLIRTPSDLLSHEFYCGRSPLGWRTFTVSQCFTAI